MKITLPDRTTADLTSPTGLRRAINALIREELSDESRATLFLPPHIEVVRRELIKLKRNLESQLADSNEKMRMARAISVQRNDGEEAQDWILEFVDSDQWGSLDWRSRTKRFLMHVENTLTDVSHEIRQHNVNSNEDNSVLSDDDLLRAILEHRQEIEDEAGTADHALWKAAGIE